MKKHLYLSLTLLISGCEMAPEYLRPEIETPTEFAEIAKSTIQWRVATPNEFADRENWWQEFNDPALDALILKVESSNYDLEAWLHRIEQANSLSDTQLAELFPELALAVNPSRYKNSKNSPLLHNNPQGQNIYSDISSSFNLDYELDVWGRVRNKYRAAGYHLHSLAADYQSALLSTKMELAKTYFQLKLLSRFKEIRTTQLKLTEENYNHLLHKFHQGSIAETQLLKQEEALIKAKNSLTDLTTELTKTTSAIAVLVGENPSSFTITVDSNFNLLPQIPVYLPSELLERRPDIASAEIKMRQSNEEIGAARAAFFPSINLVGSAGYESILSNNLFNSSSKLWSLGGTVNLPIFNMGSTTANLSRAEAKYLEDVALYKQQVLTAFSDVENALANFKAQVLIEENARKNMRNKLKATTHFINKYKEGLISSYDLNNIKIELLETQAQTFADHNSLILANLILIKALGGGY